MKTFLTKSEAAKLQGSTPRKGAYNFGELHPYLFEGTVYNTARALGKISILLTHVGTYELDCSVLKKAKCPVCGEEEIIVNMCTASVLSGAHILRGHCTACGEEIAFLDNDYYHYLRNYVLENVHKPDETKPKKFLVGIDGKEIQI